jgi:cardiolipin synthase
MMSAETIVFVFTDLQQTAFKLLPGLQAEYQSTECHELTDTAIFRFDQREVEKAMAHAVTRGVAVHALIAHTNRAGERNLRRLEMRLLAAGVTVARTADDLLRYHGKFMIVDRRELYVLGFNLTYLRYRTIPQLRSGHTGPRPGARSGKTFRGRFATEPVRAGVGFAGSEPVECAAASGGVYCRREETTAHHPKISDPAMIRLLEERAKAGVDIRILGKITRKNPRLANRKTPIRLHTRTMVRDGRFVFVGSQSLRTMELDMRREVWSDFSRRKGSQPDLEDT